WQPRGRWQHMLSLHPDDVAALREHLKAHIEGRSASFDVEFRLVVPGGTRWFSQRGIALRDASGKAYRMVGSIGDIEERKREQDERQRLEARLRQAQRFEAMGTLAGGIAHDFNNILGAILGYSDRGLRSVEPGSRLRRDLDHVVAASHRGRALVDAILAFSH